ncbi:hypothetical protein GUJ93_ZPchr0013g34932 [Zizania palustris]|uniref:Uncharacterized protein n=1 Tax=Zizania palustris TaxID=103762 RepID=A0A8J5WWV8_ZIZPA|nr:hypothetical protein GUJ93_ZPchr0013g34932 [Zizania palustris]
MTAALLLRGGLAPIHAAAPAFRSFRAAPLLPRRRPSRPVAAASFAAASPGDGGTTAAADAVLQGATDFSAAAKAGGHGLVGGPNGAIPPTTKSTSVETIVERVIFDFRFLALLAVAGSLAGSLLCFLNGCVYIKDAYSVYWTSCVKGVHTGQMVLKVVEAIGKTEVDEDHLPGRAENKSRACHRYDSSGEDVREEQDGEDNHGDGPA